MSTINDGGPAFPLNSDVHPECDPEWCGMTLRDYFAAQCVSSLLMVCPHDSREGQDYVTYCAGLSYNMADAMLRAREGKR